MQRILQRGEIEAIDQINFPRIRLPEIGSLFAERAARLRQLADGNPIADYILFVAQIVDAQHQALATLHAPELPGDAIALAQQHSMPLMPAADHLDPAWHQVLDTMLARLGSTHGLPAALQPLIDALREMPHAEREAVARRLLQKEVAARDVGMAPFVMAALQVVFTQRAAHLAVGDVPYTEPASICPVCASEPVASVLRIGGKANGHRYLHCSTCCTE
ncbi:MAG: formate dehydrogenase accessory protein FdhE, partial [Comamonas sp.]